MRKNILFSILSIGTNYVFPILIIPAIISIYGLREYGWLSLMLSLSGVVVLFSNLNLENTFPSLHINFNRHNLYGIIISRGGALALSVSLCVLFLFFSNRTAIVDFLIIVSPVSGCIIGCNFWFINKQDFKSIFIFNLTAKIFSVSLSFLSIYMKSDIVIVGLLMNSWYFFSGVMCFINARRDLSGGKGYRINYLLKKIIPGFTSSLASLAMTLLVQPIISLVTMNDYSVIGVYSVADKIIRAIAGVFDAINNVIYAKLSSMSNQKEKDNIITIVFIVHSTLVFVGILAAYVASRYLILFGNGKYDLNGLVLMSGAIIFVIVIGNVMSSIILFENRIFHPVSLVIMVSSLLFVSLIVLPGGDKDVFFFLRCLLIAEFTSMICKGGLVWRKSLYCK